MQEIVANLHMHTRYSDGTGTHSDIAEAALEAGLDVVITTDHNVWVAGPEGYIDGQGRRMLLLVGEEIHDQERDPQANHLLAFGTGMEMAQLAKDPQQLIDAIDQQGGLSFLAHPFETAAPAFGEPDLSWVDWQVTGYTGIELWNAMSEFKSLLRSRLHAIFYSFAPRWIAAGPPPETIQKWDSLLGGGRRVVAIGGSDAHAFQYNLGPFRKTLFPYRFHFQSINTHLIVAEPLTGDPIHDQHLIYEALRSGRAFIGNDLAAPTRGFRFTAQGKDSRAWMGEEIKAKNGITLQIRLPRRAECVLLKDGEAIKTWNQRETCTHITTEPGVYRVEVYIRYLHRRRGWIFSNPIYLLPQD